MKKKKWIVIISLFAVVILLIILLSGNCPFYKTNWGYSGIDVRIEYPETNITNEILISDFENESKIVINEINLDNGIDFLFLDDNLTSDELNRTYSYIAFRSGTFIITVEYQSPNPLIGTYSNNEGKEEVEGKVNEQIVLDKIVVDQYTDSVIKYLNDELNVQHEEITIYEQYYFEEC